MPVLAVPGSAAPAPPPVTTDGLLDRERCPRFTRLLLATGRGRGTEIDPDDEALPSVLENLVGGGR